MYPALFRGVILPLSEKALGLPTVKHFRQLMDSQWWPLERLVSLQTQKLADILLHAKRTIPHFRDALAAFPESRLENDPRGVLEELPLLFKEQVRENFPGRMISQALSRGDYRETATAGSTGKPLKYVVSRDGYAAWWAHHFRAFEAAGYRLGDRIVYIAAIRGLTPSRRVRDFLMRQVQLDAFQTSEQLFEQYLEKIRKHRPRILRGYPEMLFLLADAAERKGVTDIRPVSIITNSNKLHDFQRKHIERVFQAPVFDYYSCPESGAFAFECDRHRGYHLALEHGLVELFEYPDGFPNRHATGVTLGGSQGGGAGTTHNVTAAGSSVTGAIVSTNLDNRAMGFIRYVTGDFATASSGPNGMGGRCPCGRGLPLIDSVEGRAHNLIITKDGRYLHGVLFENLVLHLDTLKDLGQWVDRVQLVQETEDLVVVNVVRKPESGSALPGGVSIQERSLSTIVAELKKLLGAGMEVEVRFVDSIEQPLSGKRQLVVSKVLPQRMKPEESS